MKRPVYLILGTPGSGRREILSDLLNDGVSPAETAVTFISDAEPENAIVSQLGRVLPWKWTDHRSIQASVPEDCDLVFFVTEGLRNPVDQIEAFRTWIQNEHLELARIFFVVDCQLAEKTPALLPWFDACIHFSDVVLLNRREGVPNKWVSDFIDRYASQFFPCLFEQVKAFRVRNPALLLELQARRISQAFEEDQMHGLGDIEVGFEDDDEGEKDGADDEDLRPQDDLYFQRRAGGRRVKDIPNIAEFL